MSIKKEHERLSQSTMLENLTRDLQITEMLTVYESDWTDEHNYGVFCALVPNDKIEYVLSGTGWNFSYDEGIPGAIIYHNDGEEQVQYLRFGNDKDLEPLIIERDFHDMRDNYQEISEEFRLFHRLYHDRKADQYIKIDDSGNETVVAIVEENRVQIRVKEIRQFLAIKDMHLAIQFDCREHSFQSLVELSIQEGGKDQRSDLAHWELYFGSFGGLSEHQTYSRLLGKRLIHPLPKSKSGFWGYAEEIEKKYVDFIINTDENGDDLTYTSDPDSLANYFGANPKAPHYLTPVHFRKEVLDKYYHQPSKYSVADSILGCGSLWSLQIDNHHDDKVCVWLGDLGRDLPQEEQLHWRVYNIPPYGSVSETYFKRQILAQFTDSERLEHLFIHQYQSLQQACKDYLGWQLILPLSPEDEHYLKCLRIPATNEQRDFDELVLGLTKILIDSLNEKELNKLIPDDERAFKR